MIIDENYNVIESHNREHSGTIEGLGPIFNYLKAIDDNVSEDTILLLTGQQITNFIMKEKKRQLTN